MQKEEVIRKIHREMLIKLSSKFDKSEGSWAYDILKPPSKEIYNIGKNISEVDRKRSIFNLKGEDLEDFVQQFTPVKRRVPTHSSAIVRISGAEGTVIPKNTIVSSVSHDYTTIEEVVLGDDGEADVKVECTVAGSEGNTLIGEINFFRTNISGAETVKNITEADGGYDKEDDESLRKRYFDYIKLPVTSGNIYHYLLWASEIDGTGVIRVQPLWDGDNTVKLVIIDSNGQPASAELVEEIQNHIDPKGELVEGRYTKWGHGYGKAPVGAFCTVTSAKSKLIDVAAEIKLEENVEVESVVNEFKYLISDEFTQIALDEGKSIISIAKVGSILLKIPGVVDYKMSTLNINGQQDNIELKDDEVALFNEVIFNEY